MPFESSAHPEIGPRFALGAFMRSFENIFFRQYPFAQVTFHSTLTGKPSPLAFALAKNLLETQLSHPQSDLFMIGDSLSSDIRGGNANGFQTILVRTGGNYRGEEITDPACQPNYIVEDIREAVQKVIDLSKL